MTEFEVFKKEDQILTSNSISRIFKNYDPEKDAEAILYLVNLKIKNHETRLNIVKRKLNAID